MENKNKKLTLKIVHNTMDKELNLGADTMNELIEKIIEWQTMGSFDRDFFEKKGRLNEELNSGWYYEKQ